MVLQDLFTTVKVLKGKIQNESLVFRILTTYGSGLLIGLFIFSTFQDRPIKDIICHPRDVLEMVQDLCVGNLQ